MDYELVCALWFSRRETEIRQANVIRIGAATMMARKLGPDWWTPLTDTSDEAALLADAYEANSQPS